MKNIKVLTGTMLSLMLCVVSVYPAIAAPRMPVRGGQLISQTRSGETVRGTIQAIRNDQVTLRLPNGETVVVEISETKRDELGLLPGMDIMVTLDDMGTMATQVTVVNPDEDTNRVTTTQTSTTTTRTAQTPSRMVRVTGDVISCEGTNLQLRLPDGNIRNYVVTPDQCNEAFIRPGRRVIIDADETNMISNIQEPVRALW